MYDFIKRFNESISGQDDPACDAYKRGLRHSRTNGLGAHQCDFRRHNGGPGASLYSKFPDQIRLVEGRD